MSEPDPLSQARARFNLALERLEASINRRLDDDRASAELEAQVALLVRDRAEMGDTLDRMSRALDDLRATQDQVERHVMAAMATVEQVLAPVARDPASGADSATRKPFDPGAD